MRRDSSSVQAQALLEKIPSGLLNFLEMFGGLHCGFNFRMLLAIFL